MFLRFMCEEYVLDKTAEECVQLTCTAKDMPLHTNANTHTHTAVKLSYPKVCCQSLSFAYSFPIARHPPARKKAGRETNIVVEHHRQQK